MESWHVLVLSLSVCPCVCRCHPLHPPGGLPSLLGRGPAPVVRTDQGRRLRRKSHVSLLPVTGQVSLCSDASKNSKNKILLGESPGNFVTFYGIEHHIEFYERDKWLIVIVSLPKDIGNVG